MRRSCGESTSAEVEAEMEAEVGAEGAGGTEDERATVPDSGGVAKALGERASTRASIGEDRAIGSPNGSPP
jgi:hypothetical protein